jgi:hypothetical protein
MPGLRSHADARVPAVSSTPVLACVLRVQIDDPEYLEEALNDVFEVRDMVVGEDMWYAGTRMGRGVECAVDAVASGGAPF